MKRSNHTKKKGDHRPIVTCRNCGREFPSKFAMKQHVCWEERHHG